MVPNETHSRYHHGDLRNALIEAATTVLVEKGAAALSLREVAKVAGVSHAAPYRHFRDKAALLRVLAQGGFERLTAAINMAAENSPHNPEQKLIEAGVAYVRIAVQHPEITRLMFAGTVEPQQDHSYLAASAASYEALLDIIREGIAQGTFRQQPPQQLVLVAWASMHGLAMLAVASLLEVDVDDEPALDTLIRSVARNVIYGIVK
jgi:AcrR family transcriptional regulator